MERIVLAPEYKPVSFYTPTMNNALDALEASESILTAVSESESIPIETTQFMGLTENYRRTLELTYIENLLKALEHELSTT